MVLDILRQAGGHEIVGFVDSNREMIGRRIDGLEVLGHPDELPEIKARFGATGGVVAIGDNGVRRSFADRLEELGFEYDSSITAPVTGDTIGSELKPYRVHDALWEVPLLSFRDAQGKKMSCYLWPLFEGRRSTGDGRLSR